MKSPIVKRSVVLSGHKTSVSLGGEYWNTLKEIAAGRNITLTELVRAIDAQRQHGNLSSALKLFVLEQYLANTSEREKPSDEMLDRHLVFATSSDPAHASHRFQLALNSAFAASSVAAAPSGGRLSTERATARRFARPLGASWQG